MKQGASGSIGGGHNAKHKSKANSQNAEIVDGELEKLVRGETVINEDGTLRQHYNFERLKFVLERYRATKKKIPWIAKNGLPLVHVATNSIVLQMLCKAGGERILDMLNKDNNTTLYYAVRNKKEHRIKVLLEAGASPFVINANGRTSLEEMILNDMTDLVIDYMKWIISKKIEFDKQKLFASGIKIERPDFSMFLLREMKEQKVPYNKEVFLKIAARNGELELVKYLLQVGADIDSIVPQIQENINHLFPEVGSLLKEKRAQKEQYLKDLDAQVESKRQYNEYNFSKSPLILIHVAEEKRWDRFEDLLTDKSLKLDLNLHDANGITPLHLAASEGKLDIVELLLKKKVNMTAQTLKGETALHLAAKNGHTEVAQLLLDTHSELVNQPTEKGKTPLDLALAKERGQTAGLLFQYKGIANKTLGSPVVLIEEAKKKEKEKTIEEVGASYNLEEDFPVLSIGKKMKK